MILPDWLYFSLGVTSVFFHNQARDGVGARSLFYGWNGETFHFSGEMKGLKDHVRCDIHELPAGHLYSSYDGLKKYEPFRDMLPEPIANREKLRFVMGTGMDDLIGAKIDPGDINQRPKAAYGLPFASFEGPYYYDEFLRQFPPAYEEQTIRWDPFK